MAILRSEIANVIQQNFGIHLESSDVEQVLMQEATILDEEVIREIQKMKMQVGKKYVVHAHLDDESYRIVASAKVDRYLSKEKAVYESGQEVDILIWQKTDLGFKAIINDEYSGLLYESEIFQPLHTGMRMKAYVKQVREDGKIDLLLQKPGQAKVEDFSATLLDYIREQGGRIALNDKSPAEEIYATFGVSKKTFKKAVGDLYKKHLVVLEEDGIRIRN